MTYTCLITCHYIQHHSITCFITCTITWCITCHYIQHHSITCSSICSITCSITCLITYSATCHDMHCMTLNFLSPWSRASCASFHSQGASLLNLDLKRRWCSRSSLSAAMIDEGLAREDLPQPPWTWKHRARVSKDNPQWNTKSSELQATVRYK